MVNRVPHRISKTNRELIPISIEPEDPMYFAQPNSILTTRFSVCLHIFLANLKFDPKSRRYIMEAQNTLGTPQSILNSISQPYTSSLIQSRVILDVYSQQEEINVVLGLTKLIFHYLELTSGHRRTWWSIIGGGRRDSFPHRLLSFLTNSTKYIFVSSSRLVFLLELGITFAYIKLISKLLNPNNHQHNKTTKLQLCWRYIINRNEHQFLPKK